MYAISKIVAETFQGNPCKKAGHTERYVKGGACVVCVLAKKKKLYAENPEKYKADNNKRRTENPEKYGECSKKQYAENKEFYKVKSREYQLANPNMFRYHTALRRARVLQQTPPWADLEKIKEIYMNCPAGYDVDHIHPISKGGLHIHWNLQHLPLSENRSKGSKIL